jgi:hypothetical protein
MQPLYDCGDMMSALDDTTDLASKPMIDAYRRSGRLSGRCLCGAVHIAIDGHYVAAVGACHCSMCQRSAGVMWAAFMADADAVTVTGEVTTYASTPFAERAFCPVCGSNLWLRNSDDPAAAYELCPPCSPRRRSSR